MTGSDDSYCLQFSSRCRPVTVLEPEAQPGNLVRSAWASRPPLDVGINRAVYHEDLPDVSSSLQWSLS